MFEIRKTLEISVGFLSLINKAGRFLRFKMEEKIARYGG